MRKIISITLFASLAFGIFALASESDKDKTLPDREQFELKAIEADILDCQLSIEQTEKKYNELQARLPLLSKTLDKRIEEIKSKYGCKVTSLHPITCQKIDKADKDKAVDKSETQK